RWQVELIFRFLKRTMHGLHLMCHHPSGIETHFTLSMISYIRLLHLKQKCAPVETIKIDDVEFGNHEQNDEMESESR
ncbi:transposase, partial [Methylobacterium organophilum]|uniref:transposase n=1 Tax=Methylobacterium organophilum TaxID=410 RepID=UPI001EE18F93